MAGPRTKRDLPEMVEQLSRQLDLLTDYAKHAIDDHRPEYLPEVAGKLRVLLVSSRRNKPLLFTVAQRLDHVPKLTLGGPPIKPAPGDPGPGDEITLDQYFDLQAVTVRTSAGLVSMTKRELIRAWCEQLGGVHEDWEVDEALTNAVRGPLLINDVQPSAIELANCVRITLKYGRHLVEMGRARSEAETSGRQGR